MPLQGHLAHQVPGWAPWRSRHPISRPFDHAHDPGPEIRSGLVCVTQQSSAIDIMFAWPYPASDQPATKSGTRRCDCDRPSTRRFSLRGRHPHRRSVADATAAVRPGCRGTGDNRHSSGVAGRAGPGLAVRRGASEREGKGRVSCCAQEGADGRFLITVGRDDHPHQRGGPGWWEGRAGTRVRGYATPAERYVKAIRLQRLKRRLTGVERQLRASTVSVVRGGKALLRQRNNLAAAGLTARQWRREWEASRLFLTADGDKSKAWGNETIRWNPDAGWLESSSLPHSPTWRTSHTVATGSQAQSSLATEAMRSWHKHPPAPSATTSPAVRIPQTHLATAGS
jgi:hypothetical protein